MKFDCILSNPPFAKGLHEKMELKYFDICQGDIVWVSPISFLLGKKPNKKLIGMLDLYNSNITTISSTDYFDAQISAPMGIVHCDNNKKTNSITYNDKIYDSCYNISNYSSDPIMLEFKKCIDTIIQKNGNIEQYFSLAHKYLPASGVNRFYNDNPDQNWNVLGVQIIRGHGNLYNPKNDFYTIISNNDKFLTKKLGIYKDLYEHEIPNRSVDSNQNFSFNFYIHANTLQELTNIINYLKTDFCRACLYLSKTTIMLGNGELKQIPSFDFNSYIFDNEPAIIDDYLFNTYLNNLSYDINEIRNRIETILPDYYNIRIKN